MALTELTWEEISRYTPIENNDHLPLFEHGGKYYLVIELGIASVRRVFDLSQFALDAYISGDKTANDLGFYAQEGKWPPTNTEKHQSELEFLKSELQLVHDVSLPNNPKLFEEFPELKPVYEQWLSEQVEFDWRGKFSYNYLSLSKEPEKVLPKETEILVSGGEAYNRKSSVSLRVGDKVEGIVKSVTPSIMRIGISSGVEGFVHTPHNRIAIAGIRATAKRSVYVSSISNLGNLSKNLARKRQYLKPKKNIIRRGQIVEVEVTGLHPLSLSIVNVPKKSLSRSKHIIKMAEK